jgi:hypothetical protein
MSSGMCYLVVSTLVPAVQEKQDNYLLWLEDTLSTLTMVEAAVGS